MLKNILLTIKELGTAYYHADEGIQGCRKYSLAFWHEYRHMQQMKIKVFNWGWMWLPSITGLFGCVTCGMVLLYNDIRMFWFGGIFLIPLSIFLFIMEIDANIYSFYKIIKERCKKYDN